MVSQRVAGVPPVVATGEPEGWEIVCSSYLMVSLHSDQMRSSPSQSQSKLASHPWWNNGKGWKNILNNLRLIVQPFILFNLIQPWLTVFPIPQLSLGFALTSIHC
jgi:hypothetical protein